MPRHTPGQSPGTVSAPIPQSALDRGRLMAIRNIVSTIGKAALAVPADELNHYVDAGGLGDDASPGDVMLATAVQNLRDVAQRVRDDERREETRPA